MTTSLAEQLKKLRTPQTGLLLQGKKKPSLLFDPQEAANLDREIVLHIGQSGLQDLIKLCPAFSEFEETLFARSSLTLERSVADSKINRLLDERIERFLVLLSPYFLLNTAHKALEWLIHRFHIHEFNRNAFLALILPYHDTRMFVRALQVLDLKNTEWGWLLSLQKVGIPLSSLVLVKQVANDAGLLKMLCNHVIKATEIYSSDANSLSTLYAFFTMTLVGAIDRSENVTEIQVNAMLPALAKGLSSSVPDFEASSYMILAKLASKTRLNDETLNFFVLKALKRPQLHHEAMLLVFYLYENAQNRATSVSENLVLRVAKLPWFVEQVAKIKLIGVNVTRFVVPLLEAAFNCVTKNPARTMELGKMINDLFTRVAFDDADIDVVLKNTLKPHNINAGVSKESKDFLADLYATLERIYPVSFDAYLKRMTKTSERDEEARDILKFLMSWHTGARHAKDSLNVLGKLTHRSAEQRIAALEIIARGEVDVTEGFREMVNKALLARFSDDDVRVVKTLLNFPIERLKSLFASDTLVDELMILLAHCHTEKLSRLAQPAIKLLLEVCEEGADDTSVFIATLPYLFPSNENEVQMALQVLRSEFAKKNRYMIAVKADVGDASDAESIGLSAFHNILKWELLPPLEMILATMKFQSCRGDATSLFFSLVLLGSVCRLPVGALPNHVARDVVEMAGEIIKQFPRVKLLPECNQLNGEMVQQALRMTSQGILPVQAGTYVIEMVHRRLDIKSNPQIDFQNDPERAQLVLRILEILFDGMKHEKRFPHYSWCLKIFFQRHFASTQDMLCFLSQFFTKPVGPQSSYHCLKIALDLINRSNSVQWIFLNNTFTMNLLVALARENTDCRATAVDILKKLATTFNLTMEGYSALFFELSAKGTELSMDSQQLSFVLYNLLSPDPDVTHDIPKDLRHKLQKARQLLFDTILDRAMPIHSVAQLLEVLTHVNGSTILEELAPLGLELYETLATEPEVANSKSFTANALSNILQRFTAMTVEALRCDAVWKLFEQAASSHKLQIPAENGVLTPSAILIKQIDEIFFENLVKASALLQRKVLAKLVDIATDCEVSSIVAASSRAVRRIKIDATLVVEELKRMKEARASETPAHAQTARSKRRSIKIQTPRAEVINSREWKRGITLLEFVQRASNIEREELLVPVLFDLLRMCISFEEQSPLEYTNQLLLSTIYHLATKSVPIHDAHLQIDLISQCIRISHNPQTHHHALLVLVELFKVADVELALHNIMPIFTFVGSSVLRQDDAYSIQIISKTIETVVPIVNAANDERHACEILRIFVVSLPDIPEHRRVPLFVKLLQLLKNHLQLFYLLIFESHVLSQGKDAASQKMSSQRLEFALTISQEFEPRVLVDVCVKLVEFVKSLPVEIDEERQRRSLNFPGKHIFDVDKNTPKQLRHYKYTVVQFLSALLSSNEFVNKVALLDELETEKLKNSYEKLIVELVLLIQSASKSADLHQGKPKGKYWKVLLHNLYEILDAVNGLLPNGVFVASVRRLMNHDLLNVRRKALELMNSRLQQKKFNEDNDEDRDVLLGLIDPLVEIVKKHGLMLSPELEIIQQTALITLKLLAKVLAKENPQHFQPILDLTTELVTTKEGPMLASAVLCVAELCGSMRTHALQSLNKFAPSIIRLLNTHCHRESPDIVVISIVSAVQKIVESVGNFLSMYLDQLLVELTRLSSLYTDTEHPKIGVVVAKLKATTQKLSSCIPMRVLLPAVAKTYDLLLSSKSYQCVPSLMNILAESFNHVLPKDLQVAIPDLATFFLKVLEFRENGKIIVEEKDMEVDDEPKVATVKDVVCIEESASGAVVALVLKLSEATFRPLYYKLYDWAARNPEHKQRNITFYRLSANIAERLKSLFVLFAGHFLKHAASLLRANNLAITDEKTELTLTEESSRIELVEAILLTLYRVFTYDAHSFVNQERFETLAQPIVDQIENTTGGREAFEKRAEDLIVPCVAAFAGATQDDSLHKQLVYQTLLKTRHAEPCVRSAALSALVEIARKLGEDFMPLLPETVPFLAELLEDEDESTEKIAQNAVRTLENVLGEPLQKYF